MQKEVCMYRRIGHSCPCFGALIPDAGLLKGPDGIQQAQSSMSSARGLLWRCHHSCTSLFIGITGDTKGRGNGHAIL